jgi:hypothetical protein
MSPAIDLLPTDDDGRLVYAAPVQLSPQVWRFWLMVLALLLLVTWERSAPRR